MAASRSQLLTERDLKNLIRKSNFGLPPVSLHVKADESVWVYWRDSCEVYTIQYRVQGTPKAIEDAIAQATYQRGDRSIILTPFLSEENLRRLEATGVSGIDLCGNGVLIADKFAVWRSGAPNLFKTSQSIKNIYRGVSSLYTRCFLLQPTFESLAELTAYAVARLGPDPSGAPAGAHLAKSTASKVIKALEEEQIILRDGKRRAQLRLINPQRLLLQLQKNYQRPEGPQLVGKTALSAKEIWNRLASQSGETHIQAIMTGTSSAGHYGVLSGPDQINLYVSDMEAAADLLQIQPTRLFPNIDLTEHRSATVYFDARRDNGILWASPVQTWIELANGGPREQDAAQTLATTVFNRIMEEE